PPDVTVVSERDIGEKAVAPERVDRVLVSRGAGAGSNAEETGFRVDRVEATVVPEAHPGDVVSDCFDLPAGDGRLQHRKVGLSACARERPGDVVGLALR